MGTAMSAKEVSEAVRRVLPWILLPKFRNVITNLPIEDITPGEHELRNIEYYVATVSPTVHVPAASSLLYIPFVKFTVDTRKDTRELVVKEVDGKVVGFFYDGTYRSYNIQNLEEEARKRRGKPTTLKYESTVSKFDIEGVLRAFYRLEAGKLFAAHLASHAKKKDNITFSNLGMMKELSVIIEERGVSMEVDMRVSLFSVSVNGRRFLAPGIVPAILQLINNNAITTVTGEAKDRLNEIIEKIRDVGDRLSPVSGGLLQSTKKARFKYIVGEVDKRDENGKTRWLAEDIIKGNRVAFFANEREGTIEMTVTMYPFNPPAIIVLNYPPFNLAPIAGLLKDYYWQLKRLADAASRKLRQLNLDGTIYLRELQRLADAGVSAWDVKNALRDGYPRIERLEKMLDGFERIGTLGDIMSMAIGRVEKVDRLLVTFLGKEKEEKRGVPETRKEEEKEEVML